MNPPPKFKIKNLISSSETNGLSAVFEERDDPGQGPPRHIHRDQVEIFHVMEGTFEFLVGNQLMEVQAGGVAVVPPGAVHTFRNIGTAEGVLHFEILPPGNCEAFFDTLVNHPDQVGDFPAFFDAHGMDLAGPPLSEMPAS